MADLKRRLAVFVSVKLVNPVVRRLIEAGIPAGGATLLETTGRKTGQVRRTPVGNGLRGDEFWIVTEHGRRSACVKNIEADPRVRVKVGRRWRSGRAQVLEDDDPHERMRMLGRRANDLVVRAVGTELLVIRVDLEP